MSVGTIRAYKFAKYLDCFGWEVTVLAQGYKNGQTYLDESLIDELPESVEIYYSKAFHFVRSGKLFERPFYFLEYFTKWMCFSLHKAYGLIKKNQVDLIFATHPWCSNLIIGSILAIITNTELVLDYRDVWVWGTKRTKIRNVIYEIYKYCMNKLEYLVVRNATSIIAINEEIITLIKDKYNGRIRANYFMLSNGYDQGDIDSIKSEKNRQIFIISHTGSLRSKRCQNGLLKAAKMLCDEANEFKTNAEIWFVGQSKALNRELISSLKIGDMIHTTGIVPLKESIKRQLESNLLLLFVNFDSDIDWLISTGKVYEYLGSGVPILAIVSEMDGPAARIVKQANVGRVAGGEDVESIKGIINDYFVKWKKNEPGYFPNKRYIQDYERKNITRRLSEIFGSIIEGQMNSD